MSGKRTWLAVLGLSLLASQAGHLLAYQLRFGAYAQQVQSSGAHGYFPSVVKTSLGAIAAAIVVSLFVLGLARILSARSIRTDSGPPYLTLLAGLYTIQLACYVAQETAETLLAGAPARSATELILWGTLGQLPVAVIAAMALHWLLARFESAISEIRSALTVVQARPALAAVAIPVWDPAGGALLLSRVAGSSLSKRGPPSFLRFSSN